MSSTPPVKSTDATIKAYHATLTTLAAHSAAHEGATETAFSHLLAVTAKPHGWTLIPKKMMKAGGKTIYPDGTLQDCYSLPCGYWEAKDTHDDLDVEIRKKRAKGYPLINIIFEDTTQAVLYQNGAEHARYDLANSQAVADLLNQFYTFAKPDYEGFDQAVREFRERVPELAEGLKVRIAEGHKSNAKFEAAFGTFFALCQNALNPNISREAVDEMLVQHLLTERLFRKIFHDDEFTKRNVIAAEVETVIAALVSKSFSRDQFLKSLDRFYKAIEKKAETVEDFADKQQFLNTVYERFFQGYSVKTADTHGIVYTPQPIVDFMCASVEEVLKTEFGLTLGSKEVKILDPCTGTGNFIVNLMRRVPKKDLPRVYKEQLFANEVMLLPYYIAALNIEHAYGEITGEYEAFEGLCFADTLDLTVERQPNLFAERNTERVERQKFTPITVVIGNPPYNVGQLNENDNNKNRKYDAIDKRIKLTYSKDSKASNKNALSDAYVKFFRWAVDRLEKRDGIVCFVTNNSFVDQIAFDGMRKHLAQDFTRIYHIHLEGNVRQNPKLAGTTYNVFGIQVGVGITIAVHLAKHRNKQKLKGKKEDKEKEKRKDCRVSFVRIDKNLRREAKLAWLDEHVSIGGIPWQSLTPDEQNTWLVPEHADAFGGYIPVGSRAVKTATRTSAGAIFKTYGRGVATCRDDVVIDFQKPELIARVKKFIDDYNGEVDRLKRADSAVNIDEFVRYETIKWSRDLKLDLKRGNYANFVEDKVRNYGYRPFCKTNLFFDRVLNEEVYVFPHIFPTQQSESENRVLTVSDIGYRAPEFSIVMTDCIVDLHLCAPVDAHQSFPFYVYDEDGTNRRENITDWALKQFRVYYKDKKLTKWDIFYYVYGLLHHPGYRTKFADNLKRDLPRVPFAPDFRAFANAGKELAGLHLNYETLAPHDLRFVETPDVPLSYVVEKMKLSADKTSLRVNESLTLTGIPPEVFEYRLGNRSALDWVIDQYRVTEDKRSGVRSDPNRPDAPEAIVRLVGQVARVSIETVRIVKALPEQFAAPAAG